MSAVTVSARNRFVTVSHTRSQIPDSAPAATNGSDSVLFGRSPKSGNEEITITRGQQRGRNIFAGAIGSILTAVCFMFGSPALHTVQDGWNWAGRTFIDEPLDSNYVKQKVRPFYQSAVDSGINVAAIARAELGIKAETKPSDPLAFLQTEYLPLTDQQKQQLQEAVQAALDAQARQAKNDIAER